MNIKVGLTNWQQQADDLTEIRYAVFVVEQHVPVAMELDEHDADAIHAIALTNDGQTVGTGRLLKSGKIGRMAVLAPWRNQGIGSAILRLLTTTSLEQLGKTPYLEAQIQAIPFYENHGYVAEGDLYLDAGIEHRLMRYEQH